MHVLLVDDHPIVHETIRAIVRSLLPRAEVHSQFDLETGLAEARRLEPLALVLLDLGLPGCAGIEALERFRKAMPATRVAILSANEDELQVCRALEGGAVGYLPKTLRPKVMAEALRAILDGGTYRPHGPRS